MKKYSIGFIILLCLSILPLTTAAEAGGEKDRIMVKISHAFTVGDQALPSGRYSVSTESGDTPRLHLHNLAGESCAWLPVITRLARHTHSHTKARMVFDRVGGQHYLSEVWLDGEDGYLVLGTPKEHSHEIIHFGS
jgi:hypothetical protein